MISERSKKNLQFVWICFMNTESLIIPIKSPDFSKDIAKDVELRYDILNYKEKIKYFSLPVGKKQSYWANKRWKEWKNNSKICIN